jgi:hypothetical protein
MKFTTANLGIVSKHDLCSWDVSFRVQKDTRVERVETLTVTASEVDAWDVARAAFEALGYRVGLPTRIRLIGRWV